MGRHAKDPVLGEAYKSYVVILVGERHPKYLHRKVAIRCLDCGDVMTCEYQELRQGKKPGCRVCLRTEKQKLKENLRKAQEAMNDQRRRLRREQIKRMADSGMTHREIAAAVDLSQDRISHILCGR